MVPGYIIFGIIIVLVYSITHENRRFAATASAIRQIWSGTCRLSCRPSSYSDGGVSGLSGLTEPITAAMEAGHSRCVCESCPCALIENFLKCCNPDDIFDFSTLVQALAPTPQAIANGCICEICLCTLVEDIKETCRPALWLYSYSIEALGALIYGTYSQIHEIYLKMLRVLECGTSCRRHAQMVSPNTNYDSNENFTIVEDPKPKPAAPRFTQPQRPQPPQTASASNTAKQFTSDETSKISSSKASEESTDYAVRSSGTSSTTKYSTASSGLRPDTPEESQEHKPHMTKDSKLPRNFVTSSDETLKPRKSSVDSKLNCSKCVEQGKTCLGGCPNADARRKKNK